MEGKTGCRIKNVALVPLNREGALELGLIPCCICESDWAIFGEGYCESCRDNCEYLRRYMKIREEKIE